MMLEELFSDIETKRDAWILQEKGGRYPKNNPTASDISPCPRETALAILHWEDRPAFETGLLHRFEAGDNGERIGVAKLLQLGFTVTEQQRLYDFKDDRQRSIFRGKIDGKVEHSAYPKPLIFDYKTLDPFLFPRVRTIGDLLNHHLLQKWVKQLQLYMLMDETAVSFILLDNLKGGWRFIEVPFMEELAEQVLVQCRMAVDAVETIRAGQPEDVTLPGFHPDSAVCEKCWARGRVCNPPMLREGYQAIDDEVLAGLLDRRAELEESAAEFKAIDKQVKGMVKGKAGLIVGEWLVEGEEKQRHYQAKPAKDAYTQTYWQPKFIWLQEKQKAA